ncbi:hypothetical protein KCU62_g7531, partial [Aureobasidium sp. EXF-3399]
HSQLKTGHPVRSAIHKQLNGRLVLRWVTTWESLLLYVLLLVIVVMFLYLFVVCKSLGVRYRHKHTPLSSTARVRQNRGLDVSGCSARQKWINKVVSVKSWLVGFV